VLLLGIAQDPPSRAMLEGDLASIAAARRLKAMRSIDMYPGDLLPERSPTKDEFLGKIRAVGYDAVITVALLSVESKQRYVLGAGAYTPYPMYSFYGIFDLYYDHSLAEALGPGSYLPGQTYFLEGNVFDMRTGQIQWSMQSIDCDPADLEAFSKEYALLVIDQFYRAVDKRP
jgi:hypothetical protein